MPVLRFKELDKWLVSHGHPRDEDDPKTGTSKPNISFYCPPEYSVIECFVRSFLEQIVENGDALIVVEDVDMYRDSDAFIMNCLVEKLEGKSYSFINLPTRRWPTFCFSKRDWAKTITLFTLMTCFRWKCFLYGSHDQIMLFNWEGEIFDFYTNSKARERAMEALIRSFKLKRIRDKSRKR